MTRPVTALCLAISVGLLLLVVFVRRHSDAGDAAGARRSVGSELVDLGTAAATTTEDEPGRSPLQPDAIQPVELAPDSASSASPGTLEQDGERLQSALSSLRAVIEASTYERLDPSAVVE